MEPIKPISQTTSDANIPSSNFKLPRISSVNTSSTSIFSFNDSSGDEEDNGVDSSTQINVAVSNNEVLSTNDSTVLNGISISISPDNSGTYGQLVLGADGSKTVSLNLVVDGPDDIVNYEVRWAQVL